MLKNEGFKQVPVLYVDLDDTIRKGYSTTGKWVNGPGDVEIFEEVPGILRQFREAGWRIVGISNQGGVAMGHMTEEVCQAAMKETLRQAKYMDGVEWCPHFPDAEDPELAVCWCRKPRAGLIVQAALRLAEKYKGEAYPPHLAWMIGDRPEDAGAAEAANISFMDAAKWRDDGWRELLEGVHG